MKDDFILVLNWIYHELLECNRSCLLGQWQCIVFILGTSLM